MNAPVIYTQSLGTGPLHLIGFAHHLPFPDIRVNIGAFSANSCSRGLRLSERLEAFGPEEGKALPHPQDRKGEGILGVPCAVSSHPVASGQLGGPV